MTQDLFSIMLQRMLSRQNDVEVIDVSVARLFAARRSSGITLDVLLAKLSEEVVNFALRHTIPVEDFQTICTLFDRYLADLERCFCDGENLWLQFRELH